MNDVELNKTPLYDHHCAAKARMAPFAGFSMPILYTSIIEEHRAVRQAAGLFDVSHMGEFFFTGPEAEVCLQFLTCNDLNKLQDGKAQYSAFLNESGGVVDDIIVYRINAARFLVCVNSANIEKDFAWCLAHNHTAAKIENRSSEFGQIALQGPQSLAILGTLGIEVDFEPFSFRSAKIAGCEAIIARTGYSGEDGVEIFTPTELTTDVWETLLQAGSSFGLRRCGLGARDTLRLEACLPLYGHELRDDILALESGLSWIVKFAKGDFVGKDALLAAKEVGISRGLVGFVVEDNGIAREGEKIFSPEGQEIGFVTSGTKTPTLNRAMGMGIVGASFIPPGSQIGISVRGKILKATVVKRPLYKREK